MQSHINDGQTPSCSHLCRRYYTSCSTPGMSGIAVKDSGDAVIVNKAVSHSRHQDGSSIVYSMDYTISSKKKAYCLVLMFVLKWQFSLWLLYQVQVAHGDTDLLSLALLSKQVQEAMKKLFRQICKLLHGSH